MSSAIGKSSKSWFRKWYGIIYFDENFSRYEGWKISKKWKNCWFSSFLAFLQIFGHSYLKKFSSKHSIPYHFLNQLSELFPMVLLIFQFEQLEKLVFSAYKEIDRKLGSSVRSDHACTGLRINVDINFPIIGVTTSNTKYKFPIPFSHENPNGFFYSIRRWYHSVGTFPTNPIYFVNQWKFSI